ncbi:MAG: allantoinase AllB [Byssovorax sp.]
MPPPIDFVLRGRRVVARGAMGPLAVHVAHGVIAKVTAYDDVPPGCPVVDAGDLVVMPGIVDSHVHLNEPGRADWEGFYTGTRAAAAGGVTTVVDMPLNSIPPTTTVQHFAEKRAAAEGQLWVDVGFWGGAVPGNAAELRPLLDAGVMGFKCFMVDSGVEEFGFVTRGDLREAMGELAGAGAPLLVHAELPGPIELAAQETLGLDPRRYGSYLRSRPPAAEDQAIALLIELCRATRANVHVVHLSSASALDLLREARGEGLPISAETTPHYLHFAAEEVPDGATAFKCAPPIRERDNREKLWGGLGEGLIDLVVSDHSPCTAALKKLEAGDFAAAWGGIASLQLGLPVIWTEARRRGLSPVELAAWMCAGPARLARLEWTKGKIEKGFDADLVLWDPEAESVVDPQKIEHKNKITPYAGETLSGVVHATYLRGRKIFDRGRFYGSPEGRILKREG